MDYSVPSLVDVLSPSVMGANRALGRIPYSRVPCYHWASFQFADCRFAH